MDILTAVNLCKSYAGHKALNNLQIQIPENSVFGLLGPNGAGKTTLIRLITQILFPDSGEIRLHGEVIQSTHISKFGYLPEERGLYRKMKLQEQLIYLAKLKDVPKTEAKKKVAYWLEKFELDQWKEHAIEQLSKGMQQKVQFIASIIHSPEIIILDEPFSGFDPVNSVLLTDEILQLKNNGSTILFSTHRMETVDSLCDHIALINKGENILHGSVKNVKDRFKKNIYFVSGIGNSFPESISFKVITKEFADNEIINLQLKRNDNYSSNDVLNELMASMQIHSFTEKLPSMSEIFIDAVTK